MRRLSLVIFIICVFFSPLAHPASYDVNTQWFDTKDRMEQSRFTDAAGAEMFYVGMIVGYVMGSVDTVDDQLEPGILTKCHFGRNQVGYIIAIVKNYLMNHPEQKALDAKFLVKSAIREECENYTPN